MRSLETILEDVALLGTIPRLFFQRAEQTSEKAFLLVPTGTRGAAHVSWRDLSLRVGRAAAALQARVQAELGWADVSIAARGDTVDLADGRVAR